MHANRYLQTATLLKNGMVLVVGGFNGSLLSSAELYDPSTGTFTVTGSLNTGLDDHTATLLTSGTVLVAGGAGNGNTILSSAELYDPSTGSFTLTGSLNAARYSHTSVLLNNGTVVVSGGVINRVGTPTASAELYLPESKTNLIIGSQPTDPARATFEKYDDSGNRLLTGNLNIARDYHTATLLNNGLVFVAGGNDDDTSWQIFDQNGNALSSGLLQDGRILSAATLLTNGNVFLAGGTISPSTWEIRGQTGALVGSGNLNGARTGGASAVTLKNGNIWVSGSAYTNGDACTWEIHGTNGSLVSFGSLNSCFGAGQVQVLNNGNVILLGGGNAPGTWEIRSQTGAFVSTGSLANAFNSGVSSVLLNNGNVFFFGSCLETNPPEPPDPNGCGTLGSPSTWEIRDPNGNYVATGSLFNQRDSAGAAVLSNGSVFITGGNLSSPTWEIRNQAGALVSQGSLFNTRYGGHTLTHF